LVKRGELRLPSFSLTTTSSSMKTIIHVNQHKIRDNIGKKEKEPVLTVKTYKSNTYAHEVLIKGDSKIVYSPDSPLSCGARVWIETQAEVEITK
jgi:hypothetical protein